MSTVWKRDWHNYYPGDKWIDVLGFDGKVKTWHKRYIPAKAHYADAYRLAQRHNKPMGLAEYGSTVFDRDFRGRAEWMRDSARWLNRVNAPFGVWWDQKDPATGAGDFRLNDGPSIKAMRWMLKGEWK
jgi:hypothetical protein